MHSEASDGIPSSEIYASDGTLSISLLFTSHKMCVGALLVPQRHRVFENNASSVLPLPSFRPPFDVTLNSPSR
eukprot:2116437-Rhodomonas_salina.2